MNTIYGKCNILEPLDLGQRAGRHILVPLANILVLLADILVLLADILYVADILVCLLGMEPYTRKGIQCIHEEPYVEMLKRLLWRLQYSMYTQYVTLEPFSRHNMSLWSLY